MAADNAPFHQRRQGGDGIVDVDGDLLIGHGGAFF